MPVIAALGGNSGSQSLSVVIRAITLGELDIKEDWRLLSKQLSIGLITGLAVGSTAGLIIFFRYQNIFLSLIVLLAMIGSLVIGSIFGLDSCYTKVPSTDPALASSIFLTAITDVLVFVFLGLADYLCLYYNENYDIAIKLILTI